MLEQAIALAKAGNKQAAREILYEIVAQQPDSEHAWGWLAACAADDAERRQALQNVVRINPDNQAAQRALQPAETPAPSAHDTPPEPQPEPPPATTDAAPAQPQPDPLPRRFWNWATVSRPRAAVIFALIIIFGCCCPIGAIGALLAETDTDADPTPTAVRLAAEDIETLTAATPALIPPTAVPTETPTPTLMPTDASTPTTTPHGATHTPTHTPTPSPTPADTLVEALVIDVVDGDTIDIFIDGTEYTVRYIGIDTPETRSPTEPIEWMGPEASQANRDLVEGQTVLLEKDTSDTDQYGRLLRYVYVGDTFVNEELVRLGYAEAKAYPPDTRYHDLFLSAQDEAIAAGVGLWAQPTPAPIECLDAAYIADITVPDNTIFDPGEPFVKTWRVRNNGDCPWPPDTQLRVIEDAPLSSPGAIQVGTLQPGETIDISIDITAPTAAARYAETWRLTSGTDRFFGTDLTIIIRVQDDTQPTAAPTAPQATPQATQPAPTAAATAPPPTAPTQPPPQPTAPPAAVCSCSGDLYNCGDFSTHAAAQACYAYCWQQVGYDIHRLDGHDNDGLACESLP